MVHPLVGLCRQDRRVLPGWTLCPLERVTFPEQMVLNFPWTLYPCWQMFPKVPWWAIVPPVFWPILLAEEWYLRTPRRT